MGVRFWEVLRSCLVTSTLKSHINPKKSHGWLHQPQKVTSTPKSHINPKKSKKLKKKSKKIFWSHFVTKMLRKCSIKPKKSHYHPKKSKKSKKVKKVKKKIYFLFFTYCVRKSHIDTYIFGFGPLTPFKNPYYENIKFFPKNKIFIKSSQKSVNLSPTNGLLVFVPDLYQITGTSH